jgi:DNA-binding SARP family transcriptional activator
VGEPGHDPHRQATVSSVGVAERASRDESLSADLRVGLFGTVRLTCHALDIRIASRNARALLAILALDRRRRFRDVLAADLWPDVPETEAGAALRQALWLLKSGMVETGVDPAEVLECDNERIGLRSDITVELDAARFEACMLDDPVRVEEAIDLYRGDLAEGINLECLTRDRERLADLFEDALAEASLRRLRDGNLSGARDAALRLLRRDPLREEAHAVLIELYGLTGSRSQVSRQYRRLRTILASELNVEPLAETEHAYRTAIRRATSRADLRTMWATPSDRALGDLVPN